MHSVSPGPEQDLQLGWQHVPSGERTVGARQVRQFSLPNHVHVKHYGLQGTASHLFDAERYDQAWQSWHSVTLVPEHLEQDVLHSNPDTPSRTWAMLRSSKIKDLN